jgi:hypothetical protein
MSIAKEANTGPDFLVAALLSASLTVTSHGAQSTRSDTHSRLKP